MRVRALPIAVAVAVLVAGCTSPDGGGQPEPKRPAAAVSSAPEGYLTVVADADPVAGAVSMSRTLFDSAPVVVVARDGDRAGTLLASSAAVALGVPLLLEPASGVSNGLAAELARLGARAVLTVGRADGGSVDGGGFAAARPEVVAVPAVAERVAAATGLTFGSAEAVPDGGDVAAVAGLAVGDPVALAPENAPATTGGEAVRSLPPVRPAVPLTGTVVLTTGEPGSAAAAATARAAGARVLLTGGATDPRGSADVVSALAEDGTDTVVALGPGFADEAGLDWKVQTAATGTQLPGGGQLLFPGRLMVALYGSPGSGALGVLGEQDLPASIQRARDTAAPYEPLVDETVVPAFELIVTVASSSAGRDGNYSSEIDVEVVRPWVEAAGKAGLYVVLDLQPGRTDFVSQAELYRPLLELPYVGLALDPEWRLGPNEVHLVQIGSVGIDEVNRVVTWLADLTRAKALPQKLLILHQFRLDMLPGRANLDTSRDELAVLLHADGQGVQGAKQATWRALRQDAPPGVFWGWKNFYDEDLPVLTPEQTIAEVSPQPDFISYQ